MLLKHPCWKRITLKHIPVCEIPNFMNLLRESFSEEIFRLISLIGRGRRCRAPSRVGAARSLLVLVSLIWLYLWRLFLAARTRWTQSNALHNHSTQLSVAINTTRRVWIAQKIGNNCQFIVHIPFIHIKFSFGALDFTAYSRWLLPVGTWLSRAAKRLIKRTLLGIILYWKRFNTVL